MKLFGKVLLTACSILVSVSAFAKHNIDIYINNHSNSDLEFKLQTYHCYKSPGPRAPFTIKAKSHAKFFTSDSNALHKCYGDDKILPWDIYRNGTKIGNITIKHHWNNTNEEWVSYGVISNMSGYKVTTYCTTRESTDTGTDISSERNCTGTTNSQLKYINYIDIVSHATSNFS